MLEPNSILQKRYRVFRQLGRGGMGTVYQAIDQRVKSTVVLKQMLFEGQDMIRAFEREARLLANLQHPALPKVMDYFAERGEQYLVMEYIPGQDLSEMLRALRLPFAPPEVLRWADQLLKVLGYLHSRNPPILHRDIKPGNLKLTESGEVYLLDFGLAKGAAGQMSTIGPVLPSVPGYTPSYAPLEQILRSDERRSERHWIDILSPLNPAEAARLMENSTDERSDIYSLGATLYHLLTNETPTHAGTRALYVWRGQPDPVRPVADVNPLVPDEVSAVVESAMALSPEGRPPSAGAMRAALRDAGQSLRLHTGQLLLRQLPPEVLDAIAQRAAEQVKEEHRAKLSALNRELAEAHNAIGLMEVGLSKAEARLRAEDEQRGHRLEHLEGEIVGLKASLSSVANAVKGVEERLHRADANHTSLKREMAELAAAPPLQGAAGAPQTAAPTPAADGNASNSKEQPAPGGQPTAAPPPPPGRGSGTDIDFPVEVGEEEKHYHNEARRFARLLVSEIKLYNEQKVREGRVRGDLYRRLRDDIDRSRQMYDKRVRPEVTARYDYFHHEVVKMLADGDGSRLGKDYPAPTS